MITSHAYIEKKISSIVNQLITTHMPAGFLRDNNCYTANNCCSVKLSPQVFVESGLMSMIGRVECGAWFLKYIAQLTCILQTKNYLSWKGIAN